MTLWPVLANLFEAYSSREALSSVQGAAMTFAEVRARSLALARGLSARGMKSGDIVAVYAFNSSELLSLFAAVSALGAVWAPLNPKRSVSEAISHLQFIGARWLCCDSAAWKAAAELRSSVNLQETFCIDGPIDGSTSLNDVVLETAHFDEKTRLGGEERRDEDIVGLFQTGGTTAAPKAVMWTHSNVLAGMELWKEYLQCETESARALVVMPLSHGILQVALGMWALGAKLVIIRSFVPADILAAIERERITHLVLPPSALNALLLCDKLRSHDYSSLRFLQLGAAPATVDGLQRASEVFGGRLCIVYGQMEAQPLVWFSREDLAQAIQEGDVERLRSCGRPMTNVAVDIVDEEGQPCPRGEIGELVVKAQVVSPGYWRDPSSTNLVRRDGWHYTGDVAFRDGDGFVYLVDRQQDVIITGGYNVYSSEVEACVHGIVGVAECAVVGVDDGLLGEMVCAVVVADRYASVSAEATKVHCKAVLGPIKSPRIVEVWPALPYTPVGKVDKAAIRQRLNGS